jgi:hypothetical protein
MGAAFEAGGGTLDAPALDDVAGGGVGAVAGATEGDSALNFDCERPRRQDVLLVGEAS